MAKKMTYTDPSSDAVHVDAIWVPMGVYIDATEPAVNIDFLAYKDVATAAAVLAKALGDPEAVKKSAITAKRYSLTPAEFATFAMTVKGPDTLLNQISEVAYEIAAARLDTVDKNNVNGPKVSYFHYATNVELM